LRLIRALAAFPQLAWLSWLPWLTLLVTLGITFVVLEEARNKSETAAQETFKLRTAEIEANIRTRMVTYEQVLQGTAGLFAASDDVDRKEFKDYFDALKLADSYPGIQCLGYALRVPSGGQDRLVARVRAEGFPGFRLTPAGQRGLYTAIVYIEPFDWRNQRAFGYDMYSEPVRRAAMDRAWQQDRQALSGKVTLVQEVGRDVQPGVLLFLPVYRRGLPHATPAERHAALKGWVYAAFRMHDLMRGINGRHLGEDSATLDIEIFDGTSLRPEKLMYDSDGVDRANSSEPTAYRSIRTIKVGGRIWTIAVYSMPAFEARREEGKLAAIAFVGVTVSLLLTAVLWQLVSGRSRAMKLAEAMNRDVLERERQLKEAQTIAHIGSWDWHVASDQVACSEELFRLFGLDRPAGGAPLEFFMPMIHADDRDRVRAAIDAAVHAGAVYDLTYRIVLPDGRIREVHALGQAMFNADGGPIRLSGTLMDVTERRLTEAVLHQTLAELDDLYEHAPCGYHSLDAEGRIIRINKTELDWLGYDHAEIIGRRVVELYLPANRPLFETSFARFKETGEARNLDFDLVCKDGTIMSVLLSATAIYGENGEFVMSRSTLYDVTARKRAERDLQRLNRFYALLSHANEAIVRLQSDARLFEEICRLAVEEGGQIMAWVGMLDPESNEVRLAASAGLDDGYLAFLERNGIFHYNGPTARAILENSHYINADMADNPVMTPWRDEALKRGYRSSAAFPLRRDGRPVGALTLYSDQVNGFADEIVELFQRLVDDVSFALDFIEHDRRRRLAELRLARLNEGLEQRVAERTRMLEAANRELEAFSYSVSHDLRAPLRGIDGFSQLLERKYGTLLDETGRDYLRRVQQASKRMGELIDDLLQLSRVSRIELIRETVDLSRVAGEVLEDLRARNPERQVEFEIETGIMAHVDGRLIRVVLENLLGNAWKFTARQARPRIEFGRRMLDGRMVYYVRDNGAGFDMRYVDKLFGAFQRLHRAEDFEGTGIGLATVQRIVNRHGGRVWAEAEVDKGATFYFALD
jgi:PAS domain S-box-containing protein